MHFSSSARQISKERAVRGGASAAQSDAARGDDDGWPGRFARDGVREGARRSRGSHARRNPRPRRGSRRKSQRAGLRRAHRKPEPRDVPDRLGEGSGRGKFAWPAYAVMAGPALPSRRARGGGGRSSRRRTTHFRRRATASLGTHMRLSNATDVPALPGAPESPSTPVVSAPALPCLPPGPAAPPAPGAPSRVF